MALFLHVVEDVAEHHTVEAPLDLLQRGALESQVRPLVVLPGKVDAFG